MNTKESVKTIETLRENIAEVDREILESIKKRIDLAREIAKMKTFANIPIRDRHVEQLVRER